MKDIIYIFYFSRDFRTYGPIDPYTNPMPTTGKFIQILKRVLSNYQYPLPFQIVILLLQTIITHLSRRLLQIYQLLKLQGMYDHNIKYVRLHRYYVSDTFIFVISY